MLEEKPNNGLEGYIENCETTIHELEEELHLYSSWMKLLLIRMNRMGFTEVRFKPNDLERLKLNTPGLFVKVYLDETDNLIFRLMEDLDAD